MESLGQCLINVEGNDTHIKCVVSMVDDTYEISNSPDYSPHNDSQPPPPHRRPSNHSSPQPFPPLDAPPISPKHVDDAKKCGDC